MLGATIPTAITFPFNWVLTVPVPLDTVITSIVGILEPYIINPQSQAAALSVDLTQAPVILRRNASTTAISGSNGGTMAHSTGGR